MDETYLSNMNPAMEYDEYPLYPSVILSVSTPKVMIFNIFFIYSNADNILQNIHTLIFHLLK